MKKHSEIWNDLIKDIMVYCNLNKKDAEVMIFKALSSNIINNEIIEQINYLLEDLKK